MKRPDVVRIGGGSAGLGDGAMAAPVLVRDGEIDYLMLDYLSEIYMPMAARARRIDPQMGYVPYFPSEFYPRIAAALAQTGTKPVTNAGAVNPRACTRAMVEAEERLGLRPRIEVEVGRHYAAMFDGEPKVDRYYLPGTNALNFVLRGGLDGGCTVNLRFDPMGKSAAQDLLVILIPMPAWIRDSVAEGQIG